jgi:hypothetical protein
VLEFCCHRGARDLIRMIRILTHYAPDCRAVLCANLCKMWTWAGLEATSPW